MQVCEKIIARRGNPKDPFRLPALPVSEAERMKKIALLNVYDVRNRGDLAIVLCQVAWLKQKFPDAQFTFFSRFYQANASVFGDSSVRALLGTLPGASRFEQIVDMCKDLWVSYIWHRPDADERYRRFYEADLYALTGGGYLYSSRFPIISRNLTGICESSLLACRSGKPVIQFPQSFGPINKWLDHHHLRKLCWALPRLSARSNFSKRNLTEWGFGEKIELIPDIVFLMRRLMPECFTTGGDRRGMGMAPVEASFAVAHSPEERASNVEKMAAVAQHFHRKTGEPIILFSQVQVEGADDDTPVVRELKDKLTSLNIPVRMLAPDLNMVEYLAEFQKIRLFVGARMHACIFSFVSHTPVAGLAYQPKFIGAFEAMGRLNWTRPIDDWSLPWATQWVDDVLQNESRYRGELCEQAAKVEIQVDQGLNRVLEVGLAASSSATTDPVIARGSSRILNILGAILPMAAVGVIHYFIGPHFMLTPCYAAPCAWVTLKVGHRWGFILAAAAALLGPIVQSLGDVDFATPEVQGWNTLMRFLLFGLLVTLVAQLNRPSHSLRESVRRTTNYALERFSRFLCAAGGAIALGGVAWLHYWSNKNFVFLPLYALPCLWLTITVGFRSGTAAAVVAAIVGPVIQAHGDADYALLSIQACNSIMRFIYLQALVTLTSWTIRENRRVLV